MSPGRTATSASRCSVSLVASCRPRPSLGPRLRPGVAPLRRPTGRVFNWAPGPQSASPPQRGDSSRVPRCPRADRPPSRFGPQPSARPRSQSRAGPCVFRGPTGSRCAAPPHPDWARPHLGPRAPTGTPAATGRLVQSPPLFLGRPPSRRVGSRPNARPRLWPRSQASGPRSRRRADSAPRHPLGSPRAPSCPATTVGSAPPLGPRSAPRRRAFERFLTGPSGARNSGVRHLQDLGHAPSP
ncbi:hypothetical protein NDU88_002099 [Pleurodeles waltl]|uniref:Basic proline-rich protein-like n=1 Tax=Pleurodeles waltl TaxID=8319 RepID=A0AAV7KRU3_PLEWA|nr:hypothetical protein NDU88_002099 [Pleurodeles waltl]